MQKAKTCFEVGSECFFSQPKELGPFPKTCSLVYGVAAYLVPHKANMNFNSQWFIKRDLSGLGVVSWPFRASPFLCSYLSKGVFVLISVLFGYSLFALSAKEKKCEDVCV